jgi:hypothetical protein
MKLKYKKIILLTTMSTMGIGLLTLSISQENPRAEESLNQGITQESDVMDTDASDLTDSAFALKEPDVTLEPSVTLTPTPTPSPTPTPTPVPLPIYDFEEETPPEIVAFFKDYYVAKSSRDIDKLKAMSSDPSLAMTEDELKKGVADLHIEDYRNIKCYAKKGYEEGSYIVYIYHEIKFTSILTTAPGLARDYLVTDSEGNLKSFCGEMDPVLREYYDERLEDDDVQDLIKYTEEKKKEAKKKDEALATYWEYLDNVANQNQDSEDAGSDEE